MGRRGNLSQGKPFPVTIAEQSIAVLNRLAKLGSYGRNPAEVGGRLLEQVLTEKFMKQPKFGFPRSQRSGRKRT